ncbi:hypothetical protein ABW20_dc0101232 [Dactylellina cionopaga]|nr:hypothetical protein ABW20_dc0101232 [Dactylellina cionopaga]
MASYAQLPDELRRLLESVTAPFASTATKFLEAIPNPEQHFTRACEILITLISTATNGNSSSNGASGASDWRPMEKNIGFRLNATFTLYWLYREYDVRLNPFRSHFVETCEAETAKGKPVVSEKENANERLRRARLKMLLAILGGEGSKLADLSAKDFYTSFEQLRLGESADLRTFPDEEEPPVQAWATTTNQQQKLSTNGYHANGRQKAAGTPSPAPGQNKQPVFAQNYPQNYPSITPQKDQANAFTEETTTTVPNAIVETALSDAHVRNLSSKEKTMLLSNMKLAGRIYQPSSPSPSSSSSLDNREDAAEAYRRMLDLNFEILQSLTVEILKTYWDGPKRYTLLNTILPKLNLELRSLDLINHLVLRPTRDEPRSSSTIAGRNPTPSSNHSSNNNNNNNSDVTKSYILTTSERTHLLHVFVSNCILQLESPYGDLDGIPANPSRGRAKGPDVARKVKLLCMFITNLLTREVVTAQELYFEMQNIYMGFTTFREARELWTNATGGRGVGFVSM